MFRHTCALAWATALLASSTTAHMILQSPVPFSVDKLDNSPLGDGDFPCKQKLGFTISKLNEIPAGDNQTLQFKGSAVHGGGSCQVAITVDKEPTANSKFKVIRSFEGGCPGVSGGPATDLQFAIPKDVPSGEYTFAWTWFSKLSGQPEMYMNCAPIKVTGGAAAGKSSALDALPDMFVANLHQVDCKTPPNHATKFPNPGENPYTPNPQDASDNLAPSGSSCGASSGGGGGAAAAGGSSSAAAPSASAPSASSSSAAGGVFAPGASSAAGGASTAVASTSTLTTLLTVTATQTPVASSPVPVASSASPAAPTGTGSTANGTACSPDGAVVCNGSTKFGLCNHGQVVWQDVAAGTTCANGVISRRTPAKRMVKHKRNPHVHSF